MKILKSIIQILYDLLKRVFTPQMISTVVLTITMIFLILTFQYAHRPYVGVLGVIKSSASYYNKSTKELVADIKIKNSGNVPANNVQTNTQMFINSRLIGNIEGTSSFLLFPEQTTHGPQIFSNVEEINLDNDTMEVHVEIKYEMRITRLCTRKFKATQVLRYDYESDAWCSISGKAT